MSTPHFSSPYNFGAIPRELSEYKKCKITILPVPYDGTTSYRSGTREGPQAIINASRSMELYDEETGINVSNIGICTLDELDIVIHPEKMVERVYETRKQLIEDGKKMIMLGGEHSLSSAPVRALKEKYPNLSALHIDAHSDMAYENGGSLYDHGCVARRISEIVPVVQVGIRSIAPEDIEHAKEKGIRIFYAMEIAKSRDSSWMDEVLSKLTDDVYITFDLDALDISIMPSTGTPEPGGLQWYQTLELLKKIGEKKNVVGIDFMELRPLPDNVAPDFAAAKLVKKSIAYFWGKELAK